jgi:hypothetical protein
VRALNWLTRRGPRMLDELIEEVPIRLYLRTFALVALGCAVIYYFLTPYGQGLGRDLKPLTSVTLFDALYFSVVTISSLGYGDLSPIGFSRAIAGLEVLFGLSFMGILIAKITSRRLSYHVVRLFSSDAQRRLEEFSVRLGVAGQDLKTTMAAFGRIYQETPERRPPSDDTIQVCRTFTEAVFSLQATCAALAAHVTFEVSQGKYFSFVPADPVLRVADLLDSAFFTLRQLILSLPPVARSDVLTVEVRQQISESVAFQKGIGEAVRANCDDDATKARFVRVSETCTGVLESYFALPGERQSAQPDQVAARSDEPEGG